MTPQQIRLARHALGLPNNLMRSYRNRYIIGEGGEAYRAWMALAARQQAARHTFSGNDRIRYCFSLTLAGAKAALQPAETLDREDFPA